MRTITKYLDSAYFLLPLGIVTFVLVTTGHQRIANSMLIVEIGATVAAFIVAGCYFLRYRRLRDEAVKLSNALHSK